MLGHPMAQSAIQQLANGVDPRLVAAQFAGHALAGEIAKSLGTRLPDVKVPKKKAAPEKPKVTVMREEEIIDAEYTVIDVTSGVKHRKKAG
jgi:hypothetical protein